MKECIGGGSVCTYRQKEEEVEPELLAMVSGMNEYTKLMIFLR